MKRIYLTMLVALLCIATSQAKEEPDFTAQDFAKYNIDDFDGVADGEADFMAAALAIKANFGLDNQGFVGQTTVLDCHGMSKQDIYVQAKLWLEKFCKNDKKSELRLDGNEGSTLIARKRIKDINHGEFVKGLALEKNYNLRKNHKGISVKTDLEVNLLVNIRVDVKEGKCRLTTTIEDYGIHEPQARGLGFIPFSPGALIGEAVGNVLSAALNIDKQMIPANNFPFVESYQDDPTLSSGKNKKAAEKFERRKPTAAVAFVASFLVTQIVHDKMLSAMTSAPSFGNNSDW